LVLNLIFDICKQGITVEFVLLLIIRFSYQPYEHIRIENYSVKSYLIMKYVQQLILNLKTQIFIFQVYIYRVKYVSYYINIIINYHTKYTNETNKNR
jgi:hypothetical protein